MTAVLVTCQRVSGLIKVGEIPCVILVRDGSLIPHAPLAQRTDQIQWDKVEWKAYKADAKKCTGLLFKPGDTKLQQVDSDDILSR